MFRLFTFGTDFEESGVNGISMRAFVSGFSLLFILTATALSQNDPEAVKILDRFSALALGAPSVSMKFNFTTTDQVEGQRNQIPVPLSSARISTDSIFQIILSGSMVKHHGAIFRLKKKLQSQSPIKKIIHFKHVLQLFFQCIKKGIKAALLKKLLITT